MQDGGSKSTDSERLYLGVVHKKKWMMMKIDFIYISFLFFMYYA
jgi:hypothetical protein